MKPQTKNKISFLLYSYFFLIALFYPMQYVSFDSAYYTEFTFAGLFAGLLILWTVFAYHRPVRLTDPSDRRFCCWILVLLVLYNLFSLYINFTHSRWLWEQFNFSLAVLLWVLSSWVLGSLPVWIRSMDAREQEWLAMVRDLCHGVGEIIGVDASYLENTVSGRLQEGLDSLEENILPGMLSQSMQYVRWFAELGGFLVTFLIASVLLAKDYDGIMNHLLDQESCHVLLEVICGIVRYIATFVKAQGIIMSAIALTAAATLGIAGIQHGVLWGILAGILDALPFIGTGVVLVPLGIWQLLEGSFGRALICGVLYVVCIFLREILEPRLIGRKIGVSPIAVLVSLYAGIRLFGVWGIIKGPLGFVLIYETYHSLSKMSDRQTNEETRS